MYIGNTTSTQICYLKITVYPYVYREHNNASEVQKMQVGLSLCIQGTPYQREMNRASRRFIPMYIGNTTLAVTFIKSAAVYPYVYREHHFMMNGGNILVGLSLCIQGTRCNRKFALVPNRFIPMYIGNTIRELIAYLTQPVYPYVYREHCLPRYKSGFGNGLSLCIQGTLLL